MLFTPYNAFIDLIPQASFCTTCVKFMSCNKDECMLLNFGLKDKNYLYTNSETSKEGEDYTTTMYCCTKGVFSIKESIIFAAVFACIYRGCLLLERELCGDIDTSILWL